MTNSSITGIEINIIASLTFPAGFTVTQFADDTDPLDSANVDITSFGMGVNGDMVTWKTPNPTIATLGVLPNTDDNENLAILFQANRTGKNKIAIPDIITMTIKYPNGETRILTNGVITSGPAVKSGTSDGKTKTQVYSFAFETAI